MKKALLIGVAALFLTNFPAHSDDWDRAFKKYLQTQPDYPAPFFYRKEPCPTYMSAKYSIVLTRDGFTDPGTFCVFENVEQRSVDTWALYLRCEIREDGHLTGRIFDAVEQVQFINGLLFMKRHQLR